MSHHHADHHFGEYTPAQRADLDLVLEFNRRFAAAIDATADTRETEAYLDPDPLRYMWVDEGQGRIAEVIARAGKILDQAPPLAGHRRATLHPLAAGRRAARPAVATSRDRVVCAWTQWVPDQGDLLVAAVAPSAAHLVDAPAATLVAAPCDIYRPTSVCAADGTPWVFFGRCVDDQVGVWATRYDGATWADPELVSTREHPEFNQEAVAHPDGSVEVCWQGRHGDRFGIYSRRWSPGAPEGTAGGWGPTALVTEGVEGNVWDPAIAVLGDGGTAFAWSEYDAGSYRVVARTRAGDGTLGPLRPLSAGSDYALHPSLAVTKDRGLWCAFDRIVVSGHGGSGPTRLRPDADVGADPSHTEGSRPAGFSVPSDLLPEISASIEVVRIDDGGVWQPPGRLADALDVVPAGLPKLVATPDGGLAICYRLHRRLPLMTFYWEVACQVLGPDGWQAPTTFAGSDGTLEEVSAAATADGVVIAAQSDGRLARSLQWTEGFGGRECLYLTDHQGEVIWHSLTDVGTVGVAQVSIEAEAPDHETSDGRRTPIARSDHRTEARHWVGADATERYRATLGEREYALYWGDLHRHSLVSRCTSGDEPNLEDFYRYAWDVCEYDFWAVTDHSENSSAYQWWTIQKIADLFHIPGRFVPLYGFEWTSPHTGHQNVIYGDVRRGAPIFSAFAEPTTTPQGLWDGLARNPEFPAITIPHHPGSAMVHNDWDYYHPDYSRLVEVFQACRGNYEAPGAFRQYSDATATGTFVLDGLRRGHRFGLIASSDHGFGASYVGTYARSLDRSSIFEALHARRTFAATTRDVVVDVRIGPAFLGEEVALDGPREINVHAHGYTDLARIDVVRDGRVAHSLRPDLDLPSGWVVRPVRLEWGGSDAVTVWDGDILVSGGRVLHTAYWSPEIVSVSTAGLAWRNQTRSFGEPYGAQRGGIECTLLGPPDASVRIHSGARDQAFALGELDRPHELHGSVGHVTVQPGTGGLSSLGVTSVDFSWTDPEDTEPAFYYVRVFQVDGEMAWSSPIWVTPAGG
jgi:hypothetical protein